MILRKPKRPEFFGVMVKGQYTDKNNHVREMTFSSSPDSYVKLSKGKHPGMVTARFGSSAVRRVYVLPSDVKTLSLEWPDKTTWEKIGCLRSVSYLKVNLKTMKTKGYFLHFFKKPPVLLMTKKGKQGLAFSPVSVKMGQIVS